MHDWNVVATTQDKEFRRACELLSLGGVVHRTNYYNVVVMKVKDVEAFLVWLEQQWSKSHHFAKSVAHVRPARMSFDFSSPEEFEREARELALSVVSELEGAKFHVRLHRRGFKGSLSTTDEERFLDHVLLERLVRDGTPGGVTFDDPDAVLAIDTVDGRAGMSLWSREELGRYEFLGVD